METAACLRLVFIEGLVSPSLRVLRAVYTSGIAVAFSLGRDLLVNIGNGFHERPEFRIGLKLGLRSDPTRYRPKHFR